MPTFWNRALVFVRILFLVRAPIVVLAAMTFLALSGEMFSGFIGGLFNFEGDWAGLFLIALASELVALSTIASANTVIHCGPYRFFALPPELFLGLPDWAYWTIFLVGHAPALCLFVVIWRATGNPAMLLLAAILGFGCGLGIAIGARLGELWTSVPPLHEDPKHLAAEQPGLILGNFEQRLLGWAFARAMRNKPPRNPFSPLVQWFYAVFSPFSAGYFRPMVQGNPDLHLRNSHVFSIWLAILSLLLYVIPGRMHENYLRAHRLLEMPSLFYVLMFLMVTSWVLAGLTFFLDRYRIPLLTVIVALGLISGSTSQADHYFRVQDKATIAFPAPQTVLAKFAADGHVPILIATAGGGIQAAAWTTQVIDGMQNRFRIARLPVDFTHSIAAVSSVSGGSVGAMHFGFNLEHMARAVCEAKESSLDDVAWGWINPDVFRALMPWYRDKMVDRGWALERSLERIESVPDKECTEKQPLPRRASLGAWAIRARDERFPAFLFNSTSIDSGSPLIFATTSYPQPLNSGQTTETPTETSLGSGFQEMFGEHRDVPLVTAVRLSASFPYVSPAARPTLTSKHNGVPHVVDGGYYDNYGVFTLAHWLNDALGHMTLPAAGAPPLRILLIRIVPFAPDEPGKGKPEGLSFQLDAPLAAFMSVRSSAQQVESEDALLRFREYWAFKANVQIQDVAIQYQSDVKGCEHPPVSWKLTKQQKACVALDWEKSKKIRKAVNTIVKLIRDAGASDASDWRVNE